MGREAHQAACCLFNNYSLNTRSYSRKHFQNKNTVLGCNKQPLPIPTRAMIGR